VTIFLTLEEICARAEELLALEGDVLLIRDIGLLQSAIQRPAMSVFSEDAYDGLYLKAAALMESMTRNHALIDGNKRLAWTATKLFLGHNGVHLTAPSVGEGEALVLSVVAGTWAIADFAMTIGNWSNPYPE
jgi:death-on-curing protein